ncbi:MAG: oligoendopeptidase F, partial [Rhodobacter sp.]|nr:oligoendopeptidase F [Rhodobacter sp.]
MTLPLSRPVFDANAASGGLGNLPDWDLSDLYTAPDAPEVSRDMAWLGTACTGFAARYEGKLATLDAAAMLDCVKAYEAIDIVAGRLMSFAGLRYYQNTTDSDRAKFMADTQDKVTDHTTALVFFSLEVNRLDEDRLAHLMAGNADLARYRPVFDRLRAMRPYQLSDELEKFLHDQSTVGAAAWNRLFDETMAGLMFDVAAEAEPLNLEATLNLLTDADRSRREAAARALAAVFDRNIKLFARVHNTLAKEKEISDRWRKMPTPQTGRHLSNHVEPEVV